MVTFKYVIKDELGIHARPAGNLKKLADGLGSKVTLSCNGKSGDATRVMSVMMMAVKCGQELTVSVEGDTEAEDAETVKKFFEENL